MDYTAMPRRVLIVNSHLNEISILKNIIEEHHSSVIIETAGDGKSALNKIQQGKYQLLITDYHMPEMDGLELVRIARQIAPDIKVILLSSKISEGLKKAVNTLHINGFINKPFSSAKLLPILKQIFHPQSNNHNNPNHTIQNQLKTLQQDTGAYCIVLLNTSGFPIETAGQTWGLDLTSIGVLIAANFTTVGEMAKLLGKQSNFQSSYFEGIGEEGNNIYVYVVNEEFLLAVVFNAETKPGSVWFYTKRTVDSLKMVLANNTHHTIFSELETDVNEDISSEEKIDQFLDLELDKLFNKNFSDQPGYTKRNKEKDNHVDYKNELKD